MVFIFRNPQHGIMHLDLRRVQNFATYIPRGAYLCSRMRRGRLSLSAVSSNTLLSETHFKSELRLQLRTLNVDRMLLLAPEYSIAELIGRQIQLESTL